MTSPAPGAAAPPNSPEAPLTPGVPSSAGPLGPPWAGWAGFAIVLLVLAAYLPLLAAGYVWDDQDLILKNTAIASLSNWPQLFTQDLWAGTPLASDGSGFYRPLVALSLAFDHALAPSSATFAHLHSLAWHLLACFLLWRLLRRSVGVVGAAAGLPLFALHPVQTEAVAWISARNDPMAAALLFGALLLLERDRPGPGALLGGAALVLAALLAKEIALFAPAMLALVAIARVGRLGRLRSHLAVLLALCIYAALRAGAGVALPARADLLHIEVAAPPALAHYAQDVLWPVALAPGLHLGWPPAVPWLTLVVAVVGALLVVALGRAASAAGMVFAILALAPAIAAIASQGLVADRYLYLPMAGLALALAAAFKRVGPALLICLTMSTGGAVATTLQVRIWRDEPALWSAAVRRHPSPWVYGLIGRELDLAGQKDQAVAWYRRATAPPKPMVQACYRVAAISLDLGHPHDVLTDAQAALDAGCEPSPELLAPMAVAYALLGDWDQAELQAMRIGQDSTGLSTVVKVAADARRGELGPLRQEAARHPELPAAGLYDRVSWLLEQSGEDDAASAVRAAARQLQRPSP